MVLLDLDKEIQQVMSYSDVLFTQNSYVNVMNIEGPRFQLCDNNTGMMSVITDSVNQDISRESSLWKNVKKEKQNKSKEQRH